MKNKKKPSRYEIVSDGTSEGTVVVDLEHGITIGNVKKITWQIEAGEPAKCTIELINVSLNVESEIESEVTPKTEKWSSEALVEALRAGSDSDKMDILKKAGIVDENGKVINKKWPRVSRTPNYEDMWPNGQEFHVHRIMRICGHGGKKSKKSLSKK